jgi:heptosyltransferase-3
METLHGDGHRIAIACGPQAEETRMSRAILEQCSVPVLDFGGSLNLQELGAALEQASGFLGSDSLPMHMAAAMQVPSIAWFGPLPDAVWRPWMVPHRVVSLDLSCRPCNFEGCGDGMLGECLAGLQATTIVAQARAILPAPSTLPP